MSQIDRFHWFAKIMSAVLIAALLIGVGESGTLVGAKGRKGPSPKLIQQFSNTTQLGFGDDAPAETSTIQVSGFTTLVADVEVTLHNLGFGAASSQDMDILLIGPSGQTALILSDVGDNAATNNATITLDDQAANNLPSNSALTSGTFQPTNVQSPDTIKLPTGGNLTPNSGSALGIFNGSSPNGTWQLFTYDDSGNGNTGLLNGGWSLRITSANGVPTAGPDSFQAQAGKTLSVLGAEGVLTNDSDPDNDFLSAILAGKPAKGQLNLQDDGSFTYRANKKAKGTDTFTYLAQDPSGLNALAEVTIQVKGKKHKKNKKR